MSQIVSICDKFLLFVTNCYCLWQIVSVCDKLLQIVTNCRKVWQIAEKCEKLVQLGASATTCDQCYSITCDNWF